MGEEVIIKSLRLCASEESRCVVCEYRHHKGCIAQLQRDAAARWSDWRPRTRR